jgi:hypothetical protein
MSSSWLEVDKGSSVSQAAILPFLMVLVKKDAIFKQGNRIWDSSLKDLEQIWVIPNGPIGSDPGVLQFFPFYGRFANRPYNPICMTHVVGAVREPPLPDRLAP